MRRVVAEGLGTGLLVAIVVGSGIAAQERTSDAALQLLANSLVTAGGLAVLIVLLGPVSGAHFNPVVTLVDWLDRRHRDDNPEAPLMAGYLAAQVVGAVLGAILANAMFAKPLVRLSHHHRSAGHLLIGEVVATAGLVLLVVGLVRTAKQAQLAWAVGAYIGAAYWFTSSTSFANPAVTIGRAFTDTFSGIAPGSVPGFVGAQILGAAAGLGLATILFPAAESAHTDVLEETR